MSMIFCRSHEISAALQLLVDICYNFSRPHLIVSTTALTCFLLLRNSIRKEIMMMLIRWSFGPRSRNYKMVKLQGWMIHQRKKSCMVLFNSFITLCPICYSSTSCTGHYNPLSSDNAAPAASGTLIPCHRLMLHWAL